MSKLKGAIYSIHAKRKIIKRGKKYLFLPMKRWLERTK
jgi:hypothetical protein